MSTATKRMLFFMACGFLCLFAACGAPSLPNGQTLSGSLLATSQSKSAQVTTAPVPPTQTSCPAAGTARAIITAPLALGKHANIVYIVTEPGQNKLPTSTLKRYDVVSGDKTEILKLANTSIYSAQISADGQWLLFTSNTNAANKLQLIRMDGKGLQTLYCTPSTDYIQSVQWSTDQKSIVFSSYTQKGGSIYLLSAATGKLQTEFSWSLKGGQYAGYSLRTWLDTKRVYVTGINLDQPPAALFLLDTTKGPNQTEADLLPVVTNSVIGDFDSSYDGKQVFIDHGGCTQGGCLPPSAITVQPATGGTEHTIFSTSKYAVTSLRAVTSKKLLIVIFNNAPLGNGIDISHNGLWSINTDGSGLQRLTIDNQYTFTGLNEYTQYPWSNVSRDGKMYVVETTNAQHNPFTYSLSFGSLSGGPITTFASIGGGTALNTVGWTTF